MSISQQAGIIDPSVSVRIQSLDDRRHKFGYSNREYFLAPQGKDGDVVIAPYLAACLWFGDPRAIDLGDRPDQKHRTKEIARLSVYYGLFGDAFWAQFDDEDIETAPIIKNSQGEIHQGPRPYVGRRHPNLPRVLVTDLVTNEQILTIIDDPAGDQMAVPTNAEVEQKALSQQVREMQAQMNRLTNELARQDPQAAADLAADGIIPETSVGVDTDALAASLADASGAVSDPVADPDDPSTRPTRDTGSPSTARSKPTAKSS